MSNLSWLQNVGERYLERIRVEDPVFLVELEVGPEETTELLGHLSRCCALPWKPWAHACIALAAVQVACEAPGDERSFTRLFMKRLQRSYSQPVWEDQYGKRIEVLLQSHFPDDWRGYGAFRYVGPLYRHAGIPAIALPRFAQFLRRLVSEFGSTFTRQEYEAARQRVSGVASRFLGSEFGFQYVRNAARMLFHIDIGLIAPTELGSIPGYRRDFWTEVIAEVGKLERVDRSQTRRACSDPVLALSAEDARLVLRFDQGAIKAGGVRLNGRPVLYAEVPITFIGTPRIEVEKREHGMDRWWSPGQSPAALFRSSDGSFVASEGGVPAGDYFLVAQEAITPDGELSPDELGYLADTDYRIWRISLAPDMDVRECNLYATGSKQPPQIEFAGSRHHTLGAHVFEERLPDLLLRHWDDENARRFWIFSDDGSGPRRLEADAGCSRLPLRVPCPATGTIWVEARGFFRQASALAHLPFIVLPKGVSIEFSPQCSWIDEPAFARISVPKGWHVHSSHKQTESRMWRIPAKERVLEGALQTGDLRVPFSLRVPRVGVQMHPRDRIWWKENDVPERILHIEGIPGLRCAVWLLDDRGGQEISGRQRIGQKGVVQLRAIDFRDDLSLACSAAGEFAVRVSEGEPLRTGWHFASAARIRERIADLPDSSPVFMLPGIGQTLRAARDLQAHQVAAFDCGFVSEQTPVRDWLAGLAVCAETFDGTRLSADVSTFAEEAIRAICAWYRRAVSCVTPGSPSAEILAVRPVDFSIIPFERWRNSLIQQVRRLESQSDVVGLIENWREAVRRRDGSAIETPFAKRSGGDELTEGARKYLVAMHNAGRMKTQALNSAIGSFQRARESTNCNFVRAAAAALLELAYQQSNRTDQITGDLYREYQETGINPVEFSPWEGDHGTNLTRTRTMAADSPTTEGQ
jgi:hypothetical protein